MRAFLDRLGVQLPIIQAPMAGGPDTPELAAAVGEAGGLGSLGCAYLSAEQIDALVARTRSLAGKPFALNLFIREDDATAPADPAPILAMFRQELGLPSQGRPGKPPPSFDAQLAAVLRARPRVFSFTFGLLKPSQLDELRAANILVVGTATSLDEAEALAALGVDAIAAQGSEAGGHRGTFIGRTEESLIGTMALTRQIVAKVNIPVIAAGGIMDGAGIRAAFGLGATAVQLGTAFMLCPEAGTHPAHRAHLLSPEARRTVVTRAFSGRAARGIRNRMTDAFEGVSTPPFPVQQELTAELRAAAAAQGRTDLMQMWTGQGAPLLRELPAAVLVRALAAEAGLPIT
ncbi:MAG: nitronate monooxygenase [Polyangiaceae bacterium]|nr:nitronate monooxygenase [Polyangiaceae bacterium]